MVEKKDIRHVADLARIDISEAEEDRLRHDLERILAYVEKLKQAETGAVNPLAHVLGSVNITRSDNVEDSRYMHSSALVEAAPQHKEGYVAVRSVWNGKR